MRGLKTAPKSVDEYLDRLEAGHRATLEKVRRAIHAAAPGAEECISYGVPGFRLGGRVLLHMGAAAKHCAMYPGAHPIRALGKALAGYDTSKGTLRFPVGEPPPAALLRALVRARVEELAASKPPKTPGAKRTGSSDRKGAGPARRTASKLEKLR